MLKSKDGFNRILYQLKNKIIDFYLSKDFLFEKNEELNKTFYESNNSLALFISNKTALEARSSLLNSIGECLKIYKSLGIYLNVFKSSDENTYFCMFLYKETMYLAFKGTIDSQNNMRGTYYFDVLDGLINLYMDNKIFSSSLTYYSFILITLNHLNPNVIHFKKEDIDHLFQTTLPHIRESARQARGDSHQGARRPGTPDTPQGEHDLCAITHTLSKYKKNIF